MRRRPRVSRKEEEKMKDTMSFTPTDDASIDVEHRIGQAVRGLKKGLTKL